MKNTRMIDYVDKLKELHPELTEKEIKEIVKQGCKMLALNAAKKDQDINIESSRRKVKFLVYHYGKRNEKSSTQHTK